MLRMSSSAGLLNSLPPAQAAPQRITPPLPTPLPAVPSESTAAANTCILRTLRKQTCKCLMRSANSSVLLCPQALSAAIPSPHSARVHMKRRGIFDTQDVILPCKHAHMGGDRAMTDLVPLI